MQRLSEDDLIATLFAPMAGAGALGLRDDAALVTPRPGHDLVLTKDMLIAGVHFFAGDPPGAIARKALRVNLSDLAAKGATPLGFLLGLALPTDWTQGWLTSLAEGLAEDSRAFAFPLLGGDTVATPGPLTLSVTAFGEVATGRMVSRTALQAGDRLYVTGTIGDAALGLRLRQEARADAAWIGSIAEAAADALRERYLLPRPRLGLCDALLAHARAAMDVSDGLVGDLGKMLKLAGLTARIAASDVPMSAAARAAIRLETTLLRTALTGGDDYEILCGVAPENAPAFEQSAQRAGVAVALLGQAAPGAEPVRVVDDQGGLLDLGAGKFSHF